MQKISESTNTANPAGEFTEGNPAAGVAATLLKAQWLNAIQRELVSLVLGSGQVLTAADDGQVLKAVRMLQELASTWDKITSKPTTRDGYKLSDVFTKTETGTAIQNAVSALVASSPVALDTLKELADALGNDPNFATTVLNSLATKMPAVGGAYNPKFSGASFSAEVRGYNGSGGYIGWGSDVSGTMQFICNKGGGSTGGFVWGSVNADNASLGPLMSYTAGGMLSVPTGLSVPALTVNTTVLTQSEGYAGTYAANCAYVSTAVSKKVTGDFADAVGFVSNDATRPWMRQKSTGLVVELRPASVKDTAQLATSGWSKNADTGEITQWFEYNQGDVPGSSVVNITWPFQFPNQFLNARFSFKMPNGTTPCNAQASYSGGTTSGCTVRLEEWANAAQAGMVLVIEARGY